MHNRVCEDCQERIAEWGDDDGVLRCDGCHEIVAEAWGGDYDVLILRRNGNPRLYLMEKDDDRQPHQEQIIKSLQD